MANISKNARGYGYKYTDLAEINNYLESIGYAYYQYIECIEGNDYIYTVPIKDGKELAPRRGCRIIKAVLTGAGKDNPVQEYGSALTYARRYSLLMAFGLATTDDDGACFSSTKQSKPASKAPEKPKQTAKQAEPKPVKETPKQAETPKDSYDDYYYGMANNYADESLNYYISNAAAEETEYPEFVQEMSLTPQEVMLLKSLCTQKGLDVRKTFPKGVEVLTPEMYANAVRKLTKLPDLSFT